MANKMRIPQDTIMAKNGYRIYNGRDKRDGRLMRLLKDGENDIMIAYDMTIDEHNINMRENECYHICEIFTTIRGNRFIYARDEESDEDYLIKVVEA